MSRSRAPMALAAAAVALALSTPASAQKKYDPGASDTEIRIGNTAPYSGPASAYGVQAQVAVTYMRMLNEQGGINGRKVNLISLDDGYSPPKTVEQTRRLVEEDKVLLMYGQVGTPTASATQKYLNSRKVPQILVASGSDKWNDPKNYPWSQAITPGYGMEGKIYARYILLNKPDARIAILSQNDDSGRDYVHGFKAGLGERAKAMIVAEATYEVTDPTVDSQILALRASGADTFFHMSTIKAAAQAIRKAAETGWKPLYFLVSVSSSVGSVMEPAGLQNGVGLITAVAQKTVGDPTWDDAPDVKAFRAFLAARMPGVNPTDSVAAGGYLSVHVLQHILERSGDELTRENVMRQLASLDKLAPPMVLPGITLSTSPTDYAPYKTLQLQRFDGQRWVRFGEPLAAE